VIWREVKKLYRRAAERGFPLGGKLYDSPDAGLKCEDGRELIGFSTDAAEKIAGYSGANLFFLADEASGIDEGIFEAIEGNRAGGARLHMWSNPTKTTGYFFTRFTTAREHMPPNSLLTVSSRTVAELVEQGRAPRGVGLATMEWIREKIGEWGGPGSMLYDVRVDGNFPSESAFAIIGLGDLTAGRNRWDNALEWGEDGESVIGFVSGLEPPRGRLCAGLDPARFGDDESSLALRRGRRIIAPCSTTRGMDGKKLATWAAEIIRAEEEFDDQEVMINVDVNGIGADAYGRLKDIAEDLPTWRVNAINSSERVPYDFADAYRDGLPTYANLRAFLHFRMRAWLKAGGELPPYPKLEAEALAPSFKYDARNRLLVEPKEEIRKKLKRSPDRFDSVCLAVYEPPTDRTDETIGDEPHDGEEREGWRRGRET
jgi:hypothetical protein